MLSIDDIIRLYYEDVSIEFLKRRSNGIMGEWDYPRVLIYENNLKSEEERDITLLHEFIHARDEVIRGIDQKIGEMDEYGCTNYEEVEKEAFETYRNAPEVLVILKELYNIKS